MPGLDGEWCANTLPVTFARPATRQSPTSGGRVYISSAGGATSGPAMAGTAQPISKTDPEPGLRHHPPCLATLTTDMELNDALVGDEMGQDIATIWDRAELLCSMYESTTCPGD